MVAALLLALLTACTPASANQVEEGHWRLSLDQSWQRTQPQSLPWTLAYRSDGLTLQLTGKFSEDADARSGLTRLAIPARLALTDYAATTVEDITIPGADSAVLERFSYTEAGAPRQAVWIIATQWPYPATAALSLSGEQVSQEAIQDLLSTLEFEPQAP